MIKTGHSAFDQMRGARLHLDPPMQVFDGDEIENLFSVPSERVELIERIDGGRNR